MSRLKTSTAALALLTLFLLAHQAEPSKLGKHNFTSEWMVVMKDTLFPPLVTEMREYLVYVSFPADFSIKLETSKIFNRPCEVPSTVMKEHRGKSITPVYAEALGNGKLIVSMLESRKAVNKTSNVWFYVIEPENCTYDVGKMALDASSASVRDVMTIVPYDDTFDVFVKSKMYCDEASICSLRFSDKPELIGPAKAAIPFDDEGWDITTAKDYDPTEGYLYIVMMSKLNSTVIRRLDENLTVLQETGLNHSGSIAYWYNDDASASMCFGVSEQEIECLLLDADMKLRYEVRLFYDSYVLYYSIFQLGSNGDAVVLTILSQDPEGIESATYVQQIGADGTIGAPVKFQEYICENVYEMNTFAMKDGMFCASTMCQSVVNTKCIGPVEDREF